MEYPGRGSRRNAPAALTLPELAAEVSAELLAVVGEDRLRRTVLLGVSMGGFVAFETARRLPVPSAALVVVNVGAPAYNRMSAEDRTDEALLRMIEDNDAGVRDHPDVLEYALRTLRTDMRMTEGYGAPEPGQLPCDVVALYGADDPRLERDAAESWRAWAGEGFTIATLPGAHLDPLAGRGARTLWSTLADLRDEGFAEAVVPSQVSR